MLPAPQYRDAKIARAGGAKTSKIRRSSLRKKQGIIYLRKVGIKFRPFWYDLRVRQENLLFVTAPRLPLPRRFCLIH